MNIGIIITNKQTDKRFKEDENLGGK